MSSGNETVTPCFEAKNFLESDFPEIFLAGLGCVVLNIFYFLGWSLGDLWELLKVLWIYRPFSTEDNGQIGTRHITVGEAKQNVRDVFKRIPCLGGRPGLSYWIGFFILIIRAVIGPVIEYVHMGVDINNYVKLIDCEDTVSFISIFDPSCKIPFSR